MGFPYGPTTFDAETTGANVGAPIWGGDSTNGAGDGTVVVPGLFSSTKCAEVVCDLSGEHKAYRVSVTGQTRVWVSFDFQVPVGPPSGIRTILKCYTAADATLGMVYFTNAGIIKVRDDGSDAVGDTGFVYTGNDDGEGGATEGAEYHLLYRIDTDVSKQKLWIWRDGHYREIDSDGLPIGPGVLDYIELGLIDNGIMTVRFDNPMVTNVEQTLPDPVYVGHVLVGNPTSAGCDIVVHSLGYNAHRALIYNPGGTDAIQISGDYDVPAQDQCKIPLVALEPDTAYEYEIWGLRHAEWADTGWGRGSFRTAPRPKYPADILGMFTGCEFDTGIGLPKDTTWTPALTRGYDFYWQGGDLQYENLKTLAAGPFRQAIADQLADRPVMAEFFAKTTNIGYNPSDHDGGGGQQADVQDPSTPYAIQAWGDSWPHAAPWHEGLCRSTSVTWGRVRFVMPDFRTLARSDSDDPDTDAKLAYSAEDEAIIIAELADDSHALVVLCFDQPWPGDSADVVPKDDHMANYPNQRARINAAIAARLARGMGVFIVQADYHGLVGRDPGTGIDDTTGGAGLIGIAGSWNNTGNIRAGDWGNYDYIFGEEQDPDPEFDIAVSGELEITDDGTTITVVARGLNNDAGTVEFEVTDSWDIPFVVPIPEPPGIDLGDFALRNEIKRWYPLQGTVVNGVPERTAAIRRSPYTHGQRISHGFYTGDRVVIQLAITDLDATGTPGGRLQRVANERIIKAACAAMTGKALRWHDEWTGPVVWEATGWSLASIPITPQGPCYSTATIVIDLEELPHSPELLTWEYDIESGDPEVVDIDALAGSTGPVDAIDIRAVGSFRTTRIQDSVTEEWIRLTVPTGYFVGEPDEDALPADKALVVSGWNVWLVDATDEWDVSAGTRVDSWLDSTVQGKYPLVLTPSPFSGDFEDFRVLAEFRAGTPTGNPTIQLRTKKVTV